MTGHRPETEVLPGGFVLRPVRRSDEARVGEIAYLTGFFGDSAARYFPDPQLFADLWNRPYLYGAGGLGWVIEQGGVVVGYILGATDQQAYSREIWKVVFGRVIPAILRRQVRQPLGVAYYFLRTQLFASPHADFAVFPAHLHINLLPSARGHGLSRVLLERYLERLRELGVRGVQLSTTAENVAALRAYHKQGFIVVAEQKTRFWRPWLGRDAVHLALALPLD